MKKQTQSRATYRKALIDRNGDRPSYFYPVIDGPFGLVWINEPCRKIKQALRAARHAITTQSL